MSERPISDFRDESTESQSQLVAELGIRAMDLLTAQGTWNLLCLLVFYREQKLEVTEKAEITWPEVTQLRSGCVQAHIPGYAASLDCGLKLYL